MLIPQAIQQEHDIATIMSNQALTGWEFDLPQALDNILYLEDRVKVLYQEVRPFLKPELIVKYAPVMDPRIKSGDYRKNVLAYWNGNANQVCGAYSPCHYVEPDIASRAKLLKQFELLGYDTSKFPKTDKGNPKLDEEALLSQIKGGLGELLVEYFQTSQRRGTLRGLLSHVYSVGDNRWRISAQANPCGTNTHRMRHSVVVNMPKSSVFYGKEMRSLFIASPGMVLLGADASQLELRALACYMGNAKLMHEIDSGDFHSILWKAIEKYVHSRNTTKTIEYALIYGASDTLLGSHADYKPKGWTDFKVGKQIRKLIMQAVPSLDSLIQTVQKAAKRGYVKGIDGTPIFIRRGKEGNLLNHTVLNCLLQQCGSVVVKNAVVRFHETARNEGLTFNQVGMFHDEIQVECLPEHAERLGNIFIESMGLAGRFYKLQCPMTGEYNVGNNWSETH